MNSQGRNYGGEGYGYEGDIPHVFVYSCLIQIRSTNKNVDIISK